MPESDKTSPSTISKSQVKKEMLALQKIGEQLITLTSAQLATIPIPTILKEAIEFAHTLKTHEAKRRHLQYIGKLMRKVEIEPIQLALKKIQFQHTENSNQFHELETLRDELIAKGDTILTMVVQHFPECDITHLRQLIRKAQQDIKTQKNSGAATEIFRYLRRLKPS